MRVRIDYPIKNRSEDKLDRTLFAEALGSAIVNWSEPTSLVIGLNGSWGEGKTSIVNIAEDYIRRTQYPITIVHFNPWHWEGSKELTAAFFSELVAGIRTANPRQLFVRLISGLLHYARRLSGVDVASDRTTKAVEAFGILVAASGAGAVWQAGTGPKIVGAILIAVGFAVRMASRIATDLLARMFRKFGLGTLASAQTLEDQKKCISDGLQKHKLRFCVVVDDLDRLDRHEVREVLRLVRSNADFPGIVYLLCLDRSLVERQLDHDGEDRLFLDKIIQVPLDVPATTDGQLLDLFFASVVETAQSAGFVQKVEDRRWWDVLGYLRDCFRTPRAVQQTLTALSFQLGVFKDGLDRDVDLRDLATLCAMSVRDAAVYNALPTLRAEILNERGTQSLPDVKAALEAVAGSRPLRASLKEVLMALFPQLTKALEGRAAHEFDENWAEMKRVCSGTYFDRYFSFSIASKLMTEKQVAESLLQTNDSVSYVALLERIAQKSALQSFVFQSGKIVQVLSEQQRKSLLVACVEFGEKASTVAIGPAAFSDFLLVEELARMLVESALPEDRAALLLDIMQSADGLWIPLQLVAGSDPTLDNGRTAHRPVFNDLALQRLRPLALARLEAAAESRALLGHTYVGHALTLWSKWKNPEIAKAWFSRAIMEPNGLIAALGGIAHHVHSAHRSYWEVDLQWLLKYCNIDELKLALAQIESGVSLDERRAQTLVSLRKSVAEAESVSKPAASTGTPA